MASPPPLRPRLRPLDWIFTREPSEGRTLTLRDTEGIVAETVSLAAELAPIVGRFDGVRSIEQIAADAARATGRPADAALVAELARELDAAGMLDTPAFRERRRAVVAAFAAAPARPAAHAGGAYHGDPGRLARYIEDECLARAPARAGSGAMIGLTAPHMDLWRAAEGYGHAYRALRDALPEGIETVVLLGTSHAPMRRAFAVCEKRFDTPLGPLAPDGEAIAELARASRFDVREDQYLHKNEHSLEFQVVFLRHALGGAAAPRIVPVLCGLGDAQASGRDPALDRDAESFLAALAEVVDRRRGRVLVVAGADLAHVGPRFGDGRPLDDPGRQRLEARDEESIDLAIRRDAPAFFAQVHADLDTRRVCGLGPIYTLLRVLPATRGERLHYAQCVDPADGSIVSHTSLGFYG